MTSPVDSLTEDIDLLIASIGLLSSIVDDTQRPREVAIIGKSPRTPALALPSTPAAHDKEPPCDVPHGIEDESCPPSPSSAPVLLRLNLPKRFSDEESTSEGSAYSHDRRTDGDSGSLTPQPSLDDELASSITSSTLILSAADSFPTLDRLHIEQHIMSARSSQVLPPSPIDFPDDGITSCRPLPAPPEDEPSSRWSSDTNPKPDGVPLSEAHNIQSSRSGRSKSHSNDTTVSESPVVRNLREFSKLYNSRAALFGTHSRTRSAPANNPDEIPSSLLSGAGSTSSSHARPRPGRPSPLEAAENVRSMIDLFPLPPVPLSPPPVPPTPEEKAHPLPRQPSMRVLPSQLRYQLSQGSLRRPLPTHIPPFSRLNDRPRPRTEFHVDEDPASSSGFPGKDPRFGALPYSSPPGKTHFSIINNASTPAIGQEEYPPLPTPRPNFNQQRNEQNMHVYPASSDNAHHFQSDHPAKPVQMYQYHRGPSSPSVFSEMSMSHSDPEPGMDDDGDDDDAQSYMSNPLDGMRSPISPDDTLFLDGRPRPRRTRGGFNDEMSQPKSFFDLGFDMEIAKLEKRSRWKFWSKITKHHKRAK